MSFIWEILKLETNKKIVSFANWSAREHDIHCELKSYGLKPLGELVFHHVIKTESLALPRSIKPSLLSQI